MRVSSRGTAVLVAGLLVLGAGACGPAATTAGGDSGAVAGIGAAETPEQGAPYQVDQDSTADGAGSTDTGAGGAAGGGTHTGGRKSPRPSTSPRPSASASASTAPVIVYFRIQQQ